ncbi:aryl-sulfate sulfotransferase [Halomicrobium salinisoli]|uniref:aryl-sulfate sulfotransferase n=1 Tax=Halomicrobium salinisoli TaxID=2878391 RepID=UPI001CF05E51|nr:aryl-sulfate sulfotransferase [Halomicrobium salinisoli]
MPDGSLAPLDRRHLRGLALAVCLLAVASLAASAVTERDTAQAATAPIDGGPDRTLVAAVDGTGPGQIVAYGPNGSITYRNESLTLYHDVDPSPSGERTVEFVASDVVDEETCGGEECLRNVVRRVNLSTGAGDVVHEWSRPRNGSTQIHDVDRVNESVLLVADINYPDRVYMLDTRTDEIIWEWRVSAAYGPDSGGAYPSDWTHLNEVEWVEIDGREVVMVSLRNQDQVVFVEPGRGLLEDWTLGEDGDHDTLYEQHNPDYIPPERGGPAVLVADSENNRIVEYQREGDRWVESWTWTDERLQWPRDADRLPNGTTVIVDSHGERVLAVRPNGSVAWSRPVPAGGYDVEVLGTGEESAGGASAARLDYESERASPFDDVDPGHWLVATVPPILLHGTLFALPTWASPLDAALVLAAATAVAVWLAIESAVAVRHRRRQ